MWKYNLSLNDSIDKIREKRKCIDINIGFILQLKKWEELLKYGKEYKIYKFGNNGNLSLLDLKDFNGIYFNTGFLCLVLVKDNIIYNFIDKEKEELFKDKIEKFISVLKYLDNYNYYVKSLSFDSFSTNKNTFTIEDLLTNITCNAL